MRICRCVLVACSLLVLAGCDDSPTRPDPFAVVLTVTDPAGRPVAGLELGVAPDTAAYGGRRDVPGVPQENRIEVPWPSPFWPSCIIRYQSGTLAEARLWIEDIEGNEVALLSDEPVLAGAFERTWNGTDGQGAPVPSGVYTAHLLLKETLSDNVYFEGSQPMLRAAFFADQYLVGTTDADGRIVIDDERYFPALYDVTELPATDETGDVVGRITLGPATRFYLTDPATEASELYVRDVEGPVELALIWDPVD